jgi:hypothetical protein
VRLCKKEEATLKYCINFGVLSFALGILRGIITVVPNLYFDFWIKRKLCRAIPQTTAPQGFQSTKNSGGSANKQRTQIVFHQQNIAYSAGELVTHARVVDVISIGLRNNPHTIRDRSKNPLSDNELQKFKKSTRILNLTRILYDNCHLEVKNNDKLKFTVTIITCRLGNK